MVWTIDLEEGAQRELSKLGSEPLRRISRFLIQRLAIVDDPRSIGRALSGDRLGHLWRYRVGDYRIIADLQDERLRILVVTVGHRSDVYRH